MDHESIFHNSYIVAATTFLVLCILFYVFKIGYTTTRDPRTGEIVEKFSWKLPLAISLITWIFWHFYLYPPFQEIPSKSTEPYYGVNRASTLSDTDAVNGCHRITHHHTSSLSNMFKQRGTAPKINMVNWN